MKRLVVATSIAALVGCSSDTPPPAQAVASASSSDATHEAIRAAAERFLASVIAGDAAEAMRWLTPAAAERAAAEPDLIAPLGFTVSSLDVAEVRVVAEGEAAAQCWLTEPGSEEREEVCCLLKRGDKGWRVCGIACEAGPGEPPTVIGFEPPPTPPRPDTSSGQFVDDTPLTGARTAADGSNPTLR